MELDPIKITKPSKRQQYEWYFAWNQSPNAMYHLEGTHAVTDDWYRRPKRKKRRRRPRVSSRPLQGKHPFTIDLSVYG